MSGDFWLVSGNVTALRLAVVGKMCIYSSVPDTVCDWLHFRSCGDVCGTAVRCPWLCCPMREVC